MHRRVREEGSGNCWNCCEPFLKTCHFREEMAGATGLEPATFGVTGRHSNQLSYAPAALPEKRRAMGVDVGEPPSQVKQITVY